MYSSTTLSLINCVLYMLTCQRPCVLTCSRANVLWVSKCSRAITSNNKNKFLMTCFFFVFFLRNKTLYEKYIRQAGMFLETFILRINSTFLHFFYQVEAFDRCYDKLCTVKWIFVWVEPWTLRELFLSG